MAKEKKSFFERLTGAMQLDDDYDGYDYEEEYVEEVPDTKTVSAITPNKSKSKTIIFEASEPEAPELDIHEHDYPELEVPTNNNVFGGHDDGGLRPGEDQLTVDVVETPEEIIIKTIVGGVRPEDLDVKITRDTVTLRGSREEESTLTQHDYFHRELYWGTFSRTINLPSEINVEEADAYERHGLITLVLPKIDSNRETRIQIKSR